MFHLYSASANLNRRAPLRAFTFLNCLLLNFCLLAAPAVANAQAGQQARAGKSAAHSRAAGPVIGVQLYSFRNQMKQDVKGTLAKVKAMGFTEVEAAGYNWKSAKEFRAMLDEAGLRCVSFFADYEKLRDDLESVVRDAKDLGAQYVIVGWIPHEQTFTLEDCNRAIAHFNEWGEKLAAQGLRFAYHIHGFEFQPYEKGTLFDKLMAETKPEYVAIEMDVFWVAHPGQDPVKLLNRYGKRVELLHLKDMQKGLKGDLSGHADVESNVTLGTGQIDFPGIMRTARKVGVKYAFIEDESSRVMEQVPQSLKYIKTLQ
ncbi:MAG TPA: sugar phosphate isomerase/epimerase [Blastocatellia bacterium]|nr:sugar phosphate isomerase/epimerase [Blastocatellia bacterium]